MARTRIQPDGLRNSRFNIALTGEERLALNVVQRARSHTEPISQAELLRHHSLNELVRQYREIRSVIESDEIEKVMASDRKAVRAVAADDAIGDDDETLDEEEDEAEPEPALDG